MFKIELIDIGGDGLVGECKTPVETLAEAEIEALWEITRHLQTVDIELIHDEDLVYEVISGGCSVGAVAITVL
ncbi:hypothetical protein ES707_09374 [subsurface metagenome]